MDGTALAGLTVGITAQRRAEEQARLLRARGAQVLHGPTMCLTPAGHDADLRRVTDDLIAHPPDYLLASTGYGMRLWLEAAEGWGRRTGLLEALGRARVANRGAKAASANTAAGLDEWWRAPSERFEELVEHLLHQPLAGARVALQLHAAPVAAAVARLTAAGATVVEVDAYRAVLPDDALPAQALIHAACESELAAVTFTTAPAVHNLFTLASATGRRDALLDALNGPVLAVCVGPVCAEGALDEGVTSPLVPERTRLVPMVDALTERLRSR